MFEFIEEALDGVALTVDPCAEGEGFDPVGHGADIGPRAAPIHLFAQGVAVVSPVGEKDVARLERSQHVSGRASVVSLAFGQLEADRSAFSIDKGVDLGGQAATRATHATGSLLFFGRWRHAGEPGSTRRRSSGCRHRRRLSRQNLRRTGAGVDRQGGVAYTQVAT